MLFSTQASFFATIFALVSLAHCTPAPARNTGTTATVNGNTFTNSRTLMFELSKAYSDIPS